MKKRLAYITPTGRCTVVGFAEQARIPGEADDKFIARLWEKIKPKDALNVIILDKDDLPVHYFRNAWTISGKKVIVDMNLAKAIHMKNIREARDKALADLDGPWMRAFSTGKTKETKEVEAVRQYLRQIPQTFDLTKFSTAEELMEAWPADLPR